MAEHEHSCGYEHEHPHGADGDAGCHCSGSGSELVRFSVTAPDDLLRRFDEQIARRGDVANRSEAVRDLIRASIAKERGERVYKLADRLLGLRGVKHGELTCAATKQSLGL